MRAQPSLAATTSPTQTGAGKPRRAAGQLHVGARKRDDDRLPGREPATRGCRHRRRNVSPAEPDEHQPDPERREAYERAYRKYREVYFALNPVFASG